MGSSTSAHRVPPVVVRACRAGERPAARRREPSGPPRHASRRCRERARWCDLRRRRPRRAKVWSSASKNGFETPLCDIPKGFAARRRHEGGDVKPIETMMARRDRALADGRPYARASPASGRADVRRSRRLRPAARDVSPLPRRRRLRVFFKAPPLPASRTSDFSDAASGSTCRRPSAPPSRVERRPFPAPVRAR